MTPNTATRLPTRKAPCPIAMLRWPWRDADGSSSAANTGRSLTSPSRWESPACANKCVNRYRRFGEIGLEGRLWLRR